MGINPYRRRWPVALKAALAIAIPLTVATAVGRQDWAMTCSLGAFTVLFGPTTAGRFRARLLAAAGTGFVACAWLGAITAGAPVIHLAVMVAVAVVASMLVVALKVGPPGAFFFVLTLGVAGYVVTHGATVGHVVATVAVGAVTAWLVGMADVVVHPRGPEESAVAAAARALDEFEAADPADAATATGAVGPRADDAARARDRASLALHAAWTTVTDGSGRGLSRGRQDLVTELRDLHHRYATRTALTAHRASETHRSNGWEARPPSWEETRSVRHEVQGLRETSLGRPNARYLLADALHWPSEVLLVGLRVGLAGAAAAVIAAALGPGHTYWAVFTAAVVLHQGGTLVAQTYRGIQRLAGTVLGLALFAGIVALDPRGWWLVAVLTLLQFGIEMLVVRNYAVTAVLVTPLALTVGWVGGGRIGAGDVVRDRLVDTVIAVVVALGVLWLVGRNTPLLMFRGQGRRCIQAMEQVMADLAASRVDTAGARENRRHLYFELLEYDVVGGRALADAPAEVGPYDPMRRSIVDLGYLVLGACWHPQLRSATELFERARRGFAPILAAPVTRPRAAADIEADVRTVHQLVTDWDGR